MKIVRMVVFLLAATVATASVGESFTFVCRDRAGATLAREERPFAVQADGVRRAVVRRAELPAGTATVEILAPFARAEKGDGGYAVTSDGYLASFRAENGEYTVDGWPWSRNFLPLFGMKTAKDRAFVGLVRTLREEMRVKVAATNGVYTVSPVFELFRKVPPHDLVVDYRPLAGRDASYAGMARHYRREQLARGAVRPLAERAKTRPELARAARNVELRIRLAWKPVPSPVLEQTSSNEPPLTVAADFARCRELVRRLSDVGATNVEICLVGWQKGGHDGCWPQVFPVEPKLGGEAALRTLIAEAKAAGMQIVGHTNSTDGYSLADSWEADLAAKDGRGEPRKGGVWGGGQMYWICPRRACERFYPQVCREVAALGFRGLHYVDVMTFLPEACRCEDPKHPLFPETAVPYFGRMMRAWREAVGGFASEGPWDVNAGDLDFVLYCCFERSTPNPLLDRAIPLWQLVYNGVILQNPFTSTVNACCKGAAKRVKLAEFNGRPTGYVHSRFVSDGGDWMSKSDTEDLRLVTSADLERTVRLVAEMARDYAARSDLQFVFMEDHDEVAPGVFETTYANGVKTTADYNRGTFRIDRPASRRDSIGAATALLAATSSVAASATFDVRDFGAKGDGRTKDTAAIQRTIDAAAEAGGGEVRVPAGHYVAGSIFLRSNVDFHVAEGALLEASRDPADYNAADVCPQNSASKEENVSGGHFILAIEATNVTVRGEGTFDGNGLYFFTNGFDRARIGRTGVNGLGWKNEQDAILWRPGQMLYFVECANLRLEGVRVRNSPYWSVFIHGCSNVVAKGLSIRSVREPHVMNGDGLNFDCCRRVRVEDCDIRTSDDALCFRADGKRLRRAPAETSDVVVRRCRLSSKTEAIRLGVGEGVVRNCRFTDIAIVDTNRGIDLASTWFPSRGVDFLDIVFENVTADCAQGFLWMHRLKGRESVMRNIAFRNCSARQGDTSYVWGSRAKPFESVVFENVTLNGEIEILNVRGLAIRGGAVTPRAFTPKLVEERNRMIDACKGFIW